jgi:hypothetical protein
MARLYGFLMLLPILAAIGCLDSTLEPDEPDLQPGINIVSGGNVPDTIGAFLPNNLVVRVADDNGKPRASVAVRFRAVREDAFTVSGEQRPDHFTMFISRPGEGFIEQTDLLVLTDAQGRASVELRAGTITPHGGIEVSLPLFAATDTVLYEVLPGRAVRIERFPADTSVYRNASYTLRTAVTDRRGNVLPVDVGVHATASDLAIVDDSIVQAGPDIARGRILLAGGGIVDTAYVSIVPELRFVARGPDGFVSINLDGSDPVHYAAPLRDYMEAAWSPDGNQLALTSAGRLFFATPAGAVTEYALPPSIVDVRMPTYSLDGQHLYFTGGPKFVYGTLWRLTLANDSLVEVAGTHDEELEWLTISPESDIAYAVATRIHEKQVIAGIDLATGTVFHDDDNSAAGVRYSTVGSSLAIFRRGELEVQRPGGVYTVADPSKFYGGALGLSNFSLDWWSAQYVLASWRAPNGSYAIDLVQASTGLVLPLAWTRLWTVPRFRPN